MNDALRTTLKTLRLSGLAESLEVRPREAAGHALSHVEFLELILQDELAVRAERQIARRVKHAMFRETKTLDLFSVHVVLDPPRALLAPLEEKGHGKLLVALSEHNARPIRERLAVRRSCRLVANLPFRRRPTKKGQA